MKFLNELREMLETEKQGNKDIMYKMKKHNKNKLEAFNKQHQQEYGYKVSEDAIITLATKRMLDCYNFKEIRNILEYYEQVETTILRRTVSYDIQNKSTRRE